MIKGYIKRHQFGLGCLGIILVFQLCFLLLKKVELQDLIYLLILELLLVCMVSLCDFLLYRKQVVELRELLEHPASDLYCLSDSKDILDNIYIEMVRAQDRSRRHTENDYAELSKEMESYYNMWVHQIKTPIAGMKVLLQTMEPTQEVKELQNQLFAVEQYAEMALQYQRMQQAGKDLSFSSVDLNKVIRENIRKFARLFVGKKLGVCYEETNLRVLSDEKWLSFVLGQVLSNAIKYSNSGSIFISVYEAASFTYVSIRDEGIGICEEDLPRVFEKGYTGYNGRADKSSTGIGLFLCKSVLDMLGHTMRLESTLGKGTEVVIGISKKRRD